MSTKNTGHRQATRRTRGVAGISSELPLEAAVDRYAKGAPAGLGAPLRLHVPGHKGGVGAPPSLKRRWHRGLLLDDVTEVPGLDDLHAPHGAIRESQAFAAAALGAAHAFYLVQGTTGGLIALAMAVARANPGRRKLILPRYSHRATVGAVVLAGLDPLFCRTTFAQHRPLGMDHAHLEDLLRAHAAECAAVCELHPNASGAAGELQVTADLAHWYGLPLLVDGAHAALFGLHRALPVAPLASGADAVVLSAHKTLGSLGQSSLLLLADAPTAPPAGDVAAALRLTTTTSPSYPLLLSLEAAVAHRTSAAGLRELHRAVQAAHWLRDELRRLGLALYDAPEGWCQDPLRVNLGAAGLAADGPALAALLRDRAGVQVEAADWRSVLMVIGPADGAEDLRTVASRIAVIAAGMAGRDTASSASAGLSAAAGESARLAALSESAFAAVPPVCLRPRDAWFGHRELVELTEAAGRVAAEPLAPYPPGVPVVWPGERLTADVVQLLTAVIRAGGAVHGLEADGAEAMRCTVLHGL